MTDKIIENNQVSIMGKIASPALHSAMRYSEKAFIW